MGILPLYSSPFLTAHSVSGFHALLQLERSQYLIGGDSYVEEGDVEQDNKGGPPVSTSPLGKYEGTAKFNLHDSNKL